MGWGRKLLFWKLLFWWAMTPWWRWELNSLVLESLVDVREQGYDVMIPLKSFAPLFDQHQHLFSNLFWFSQNVFYLQPIAILYYATKRRWHSWTPWCPPKHGMGCHISASPCQSLLGIRKCFFDPHATTFFSRASLLLSTCQKILERG